MQAAVVNVSGVLYSNSAHDNYIIMKMEVMTTKTTAVAEIVVAVLAVIGVFGEVLVVAVNGWS